MRDIDFLPEWYREDRRRQSRVHRQYVTLGILFLIMIVWNAIATREISRASAELAMDESRRVEAEQICGKSGWVQDQLSQLQQMMTLADSLDSHLDAASVLAELSCVVAEPVVLRSVEFSPEQTTAGSVLGPVRFAVVLDGFAPQASDVGSLVSRLEKSEYFHTVDLIFCKAVGDEASDGPKACGTAFQIRLPVANTVLRTQAKIERGAPDAM